MYSPNIITELSPIVADDQGITPLTIKVNNLLMGNLRLSPLLCNFNLNLNGSNSNSYQTNATVIVIDESLMSRALVTCMTPVIVPKLSLNYTDAYLSLSEYNGGIILENQVRITFVQSIQITSLNPNAGYFTQENLVTIKGNGFLPEPTLLVRLYSLPFEEEIYIWQWNQIIYVNTNTIVVKMPSLNYLNQTDYLNYSNSIIQVSINQGISWSIEEPIYSFYTSPSINYLSHYNSTTLGHFNLTVYGFGFSNRITRCYFGLEFTPRDLNGGYKFTLYGNFSWFTKETTYLYWDNILINDHVDNVTSTEIKGIVPPSNYTGRVEIKVMHNLITYQNISVFFTYSNSPVVESCFPSLGPSRGGTMVVIKGNYFDEQVTCLFDNYLEIIPVRDSFNRIICEMPPHHETTAKSLNLRAWKGQFVIQTGCTYRYHLDVTVNEIQPQEFFTGATKPIMITIDGLGFTNEDPEGFSLRVRINEQVSTNVTFVSETRVIAVLPFQRIKGTYDIFFSQNYGVDYTKISPPNQLNFLQPQTVDSVYVNKVQIAASDDDPDFVEVDITMVGTGFPKDPSIPYYCAVGNLDDVPYVLRWTHAITINSNTIICKNVSQFNATMLPTARNLRIQTGYNTRDFFGDATLLYYPKIKLYHLNNYTFYETNDRLSIRVTGDNFLNTEQQLSCRITRIDDKSIYDASFIEFESPQNITCIFEMDPFINYGVFNLSVSNNYVQWIVLNQTLEIMPSVKIQNIWPSIFLVRDPTELQINHTMYVEVVQTPTMQIQCFFLPTTKLRAALYQTPTLQQLVINATRLNDTFYTCQVPPDLTDLAPVSIDVRMGYWNDPKSTSQSNFQIMILDRCPPGYYCTDTLVDCPIGHYCPGNSLYDYPRPCPVGYYQPKTRSQRCMPCIRGHKCPYEGMIDPIPCPVGVICDIQKLNSQRSECPEGSYCPIKANQGDKSYQNGLFTILTQKCNVGTYCRGGLSTNKVTEPVKFESVVTNCIQGMICHQGSYLPDGVGECPSGHYCPHQSHTGIPCPPRFYCPGRGNIEPKKCPRGTFNMHFGQQNCTNCTIGRICPVEGLLVPMLCPAGYVCNDEALIIPSNVCPIGHVCISEVMSGLQIKEMSCQTLVTIKDSLICDTNIFYQKFTDKVTNITSLSTDDPKLFEYFNNSDVCCWNSSDTYEWIINIGKSINEEHTFTMYTEQLSLMTKNISFANGTNLTLPFWDGYTIVDRFLLGQGFNGSDGLDIVSEKHNQLIRFFIQKMYTKYMGFFCPAGLLCLEAVNTYEPDSYLITAPFVCASGSYCLRASQTVIGSGLCPVGFFCPAGASFPQETQPGSFTGNIGSVEESQCSPGTFTLVPLSASCGPCPSGYECSERGTSMPRICPIGYYRSATESNICSMCPKGTFSFERSPKDYTDCLECPPGRICEVEGISNVTQTSACSDGYVCDSGTGAKLQIDCPAGYFCPTQTSLVTMYANPCNRGFFCRPQTGESTKTRDNCPQTYYCPPGTGLYNYSAIALDYSNWRLDAPTRCPRGTGFDGQDTKNNLLQCGINSNYRIMEGADLSSNYCNCPDDINDPLGRCTCSSSTTGGRLLKEQQEEFQFTGGGTDQHGRKLNNQNNNPMLLDLWEISYQIDQNTQLQFQTANASLIITSISQYLNLKRAYIYSLNPLNQSLCDQWINEEVLEYNVSLNLETAKIFTLIPNNYMLVTMDLRHLLDQTIDWVYGQDWAISFTVSTNEFYFNSTIQPVLLSEQFLNKQTSKSQLIEWELLAWTNIYVKIDILIYNTLYLNHKYAFINSTSVEIRAPNRAVMNTQNIFACIVQQADNIMLPFNQPAINDPINNLNGPQQMPSYVLTFAKYWANQQYIPINQQSTKGRNIWIPASLYWQSTSALNLAYLPYFSNCDGYGQYIPLWALIEQNQQCVNVPLDKTKYMSEFSFGQTPTADNCENINIQCIFDENAGDNQPLPRWFEIQSGAPMFHVVINPVDYNDFMTSQFTQFQFLTVSPGDSGTGGAGTIPQNFALILSYYQIGLEMKQLIIVDIEFGQFFVAPNTSYPQWTINSPPIPYNISFSFIPLSHKDLTIQFAFQAYFYIILYILMGSLSIIDMVLFALYHRLVARPDRGRIAPFRFNSYFILTIPTSSYGCGLALIPITVLDFTISVVVTGYLFTTQTNLFSCSDPSASNCQYTLFDLIVYQSGLITVDYEVLRTGRCGLVLLITGAYMLSISLNILIPDTTRLGRVQEAYNGNVWQYYRWKRSNMMYCCFWVLTYSLILLQFSFSATFSDSMYTYIVVMKVMQILFGKVLENIMKEQLLVGALDITSGIVQGLVTFGSPNFLAFIQSYFYGYGMTTFQRNYQDGIAEFFFDIVEVKIPRYLNNFTMWLNNEVQDENIDQDAVLFGTKKDNRGSGSESSDSKVQLSDENSMQENIQDESDRDRDQNIIFQTEHVQDDSSDEFIAKFKPPQKSMNSFNQSSQSKFVFEYDSESISVSSNIKTESESSKSASTIEDDVREEEVEPLNSNFAGYAGDNVAMWYNCYFVLLLWVFYNQTQVAVNYGIKLSAFIYYFLFQVVIIPFQIVIDILQHNTNEWYHHLPVHDYLDYLAFRFTQRKCLWKGNEPFVNEQIDVEQQSLDKMCFSSQWYFVMTIFVSGMCQILLGINTLLWCSSYNMFGDFGTIPLVAFSVFTCLIIHQLCLVGGRYFKIWRIDPNLEDKDTGVTDLDKDFFNLLIRISDFQKEEDIVQEEEIPHHLKFKLKAWNHLDRYKIQTMQLKADLQTDRLMADTFKELFLQRNAPWLRENVQEILTPRILFAKRQKIIEQLEKVLGEIKPDVELSELKSELDVSSSPDDEEKQEKYLAQKHKARIARLAKKFGLGGINITKMIADKKVTPMTRAIIKYWITRMRFVRKLRVYVQSIVTLNIAPECLYCRYTYGLQIELLQSIEEMFYDFLAQYNATINNFEHELWTRYFRKHARYRTVCQECYNLIENRYKMLQKKNRLASVIPEDDEEAQFILMSTKKKEKAQQRIQSISDRAKQCIHEWILLARYKLNPELIPQEDDEEEYEEELEEEFEEEVEEEFEEEGEEEQNEEEQNSDQSDEQSDQENSQDNSDEDQISLFKENYEVQEVNQAAAVDRNSQALLNSIVEQSSSISSTLGEIISDPDASQPSSIHHSTLL